MAAGLLMVMSPVTRKLSSTTSLVATPVHVVLPTERSGEACEAARFAGLARWSEVRS